MHLLPLDCGSASFSVNNNNNNNNNVPVHVVKAYRGVEVQLHVFLTSAPDGDARSASRPGRLTAWAKTPVSIEEEATEPV